MFVLLPSRRSKPREFNYFWLLPPMKAKPQCCPEKWVSNNRLQTTYSFTTKSAEFYPIFLALGFRLFLNIFGRSTPNDDFFESLRMFHGILTGDTLWSPDNCLFRSGYRRRKTFHNHFRMAREKTKLHLAEMSQKEWSAHHENLEENFFR